VSAGRLFERAFALASSTAVSVILLLLLFCLTFLGTLEQVDRGLFEVQQEYFGSLFVVHWAFGFLPLPLPGAYLLMALLFVNLLCGGVVRIRKGWRQAGILIAHAGILILLAGAFVTFQYAVRGHMSLFEGDAANEFQSSTAWEIAITAPGAGGSATQYVIPSRDFTRLRAKDTATFYHRAIPFELTVNRHLKNSRRLLTDAGREAGKSVEGHRLEILPPAKEPGENIPGAYVKMTDMGTGTIQEAVLWGADAAPLVVAAGGAQWRIALKRRTWQLPFTIALNQFIRELHPGTDKPRSFVSRVTKIDGDAQAAAEISMNKPLRHKGYTLYQASWGPANAGPNDPLFTTLAVARNPAEQVPLIATCIITFGLLVHYCLKLLGYLRAQNAGRSS